jgi:hypothetical protein
MGTPDGIDRLEKLITDNHLEVKTWRQEADTKTTTLATTVDTLAATVQGLADRIAKLESAVLPPDTDAANSSTPTLQQGDPILADGVAQPLLAGKGILDSNGVLFHGRDLHPKKPVVETQLLKTAPTSSPGADNTADGMVPHYFRFDFPRYNGKDPLPWLSRCEQFLKAQRTEPPQKIWLATFHLDGDAFHWYAHLERSRGVPSWEQFHELCNTWFRPPIRHNPLGELRLLRQTGTVADYQSRFLALLSRADPLSDRQEQ